MSIPSTKDRETLIGYARFNKTVQRRRSAGSKPKLTISTLKTNSSTTVSTFVRMNESTFIKKTGTIASNVMRTARFKMPSNASIISSFEIMRAI